MKNLACKLYSILLISKYYSYFIVGDTVSKEPVNVLTKFFRSISTLFDKSNGLFVLSYRETNQAWCFFNLSIGFVCFIVDVLLPLTNITPCWLHISSTGKSITQCKVMKLTFLLMLLSIVLVVFPFYRTTKVWLLICHLQRLLMVSNLPAVVTTSNMFKFLFVIEFWGQAFLGDRVVIIFFLKIDYKSLTFNTFLRLRTCFLFVISNSIIFAGCQVRYIWNFGTINLLNKINY